MMSKEDDWKTVKKYDNVDKIDCNLPYIHINSKGNEEQILGECELLKKTYKSKEEVLYEDSIDYIENIDLLKIDGDIIEHAFYFNIDKGFTPSNIPLEIPLKKSSICKIQVSKIDGVEYKALLCHSKDLKTDMKIIWEE